MDKQLEIYKKTSEKLRMLNFYDFVTGWDSQTEAPKGCFERRAKHAGIMAEMSYAIETDSEYEAAVLALEAQSAQLEPYIAREIKKVARSIKRTKKIPLDQYVQYSELMAVSESKFFESKLASDFASFAPYLEKIIAFQKNLIKWWSDDEIKGYNVLLDQYEEGITEADYDKFFDALKDRLVPFVKKVTAKKLKFNKAFLKKTYPADKQKEFCTYLQEVMCFDTNRGVMKTSEHPFTSGVDTSDVRFTVHYYEDNLFSAIFSAIHEMGHATYEQQINPELDDTNSGGGVSLGMHESQSRFYENIIGRSRAFWERHFSKLQQTFPKQLAKVTVDDVYKAVNTAERSFIRTEADELTYPLHVMLRYDMEKKFIKGNLPVDKFPETWNKLMKKYLGLKVTNDKEGVLQDMHWSGGSIGYFPTYAYGSAIAAQLYHKMRQEIDVDAIIASGNLSGINDWLKEKIHKYGSTLTPKQILYAATGEEFNPNYYIDYLIEKYSTLYDVQA